MQNMFVVTLIISTLVTFTTCSRFNDEVNPGFIKEGYILPYAVNEPSIVMKLDKDLTEISGLAYSTATENLLAINDENAQIFNIDPLSGKILSKINFGKPDDFEGVAYHNGIIYVAESNGNIKKVNEAKAEKIFEYDDILSRKNDIEGITYSPYTHSLLLAAKGNSQKDGNTKGEKSIFLMDIESGEINATPYHTMNIEEDIKSLKPQNINDNVLTNMSISSRLKKFSPSGIAIHPDGDIYIISSLGKLLVILSQDLETKAIVFLKASLHAQPEGICFDSKNNLYISNEGQSRKALVYKYYNSGDTENHPSGAEKNK